jgi:hypothetical protein
MSTTVKHFHSAMSGAPTLNGTAGSLIAVLDACLVDGFGLKSADSVTVSGGVGTANFSAGHSFEPDVIALVTGATPSGLNGEKRVLTTSTNTITFDATDIADGTATGTITFKIAPAGWAKPFSGTNLAAYRSTDVTGTRMFLRVDDTNVYNGRVKGYESMSDLDTGTGPFPSGDPGWWPKASSSLPTNARAWTVVADSTRIWLHTHASPYNPGSSGAIWGFGDFDSFKSSDPFACELTCALSDITGGYGPSNLSAEFVALENVAGPYVARSYTGIGGAVFADHAGEAYFTRNVLSGAGGSEITPKYPNGADNGLILSRKLIVERGATLRGVSRGLYVTPQNCHSAFAWRNKIDGMGGMAGRKLMAVKCGDPGGTASAAVVFFDITGPWG